MTYESSYQGMPVISDDNADQFIDPTVDGVKRFCTAQPQPPDVIGYAAVKPLKTYTHDEAVNRIGQKEAAKSDLISILDARGLPVKDQGQTNYCWMYGTVHACEIAYSLQGESHVPLSATAAAALLTGGSNRGGYIGEAVKFLGEHGTCPESMWPEHNLSLRNNTAAVEAAAKTNVLVEWQELPYGDTDQLLAAVLDNHPVAIELPWWHHVVCVISAKVLSGGQIGFPFDNSWGLNFGTNGRGILTPEKARGRMYIPLSVKPR